MLAVGQLPAVDHPAVHPHHPPAVPILPARPVRAVQANHQAVAVQAHTLQAHPVSLQARPVAAAVAALVILPAPAGRVAARLLALQAAVHPMRPVQVAVHMPAVRAAAAVAQVAVVPAAAHPAAAVVAAVTRRPRVQAVTHQVQAAAVAVHT